MIHLFRSNGRRFDNPDANARALDERFRAHGASVYPVGQPVDRLIGLAGVDCLVEYKNPDNWRGKRKKLSKGSQQGFADAWRGQRVRLVITVEDVDACVAELKHIGRVVAAVIAARAAGTLGTPDRTGTEPPKK